MKILAVILIVLIMPCCSSARSQRENRVDNKGVDHVDLDLYLGKWYEIARFDHSFERDMDHVTAEYSLMTNGMIRVVNAGYKGGKRSEAIGKAKPADDGDQAHLRVSFFWIFYADYIILELDRLNYSYSMVGSKSSKYLWILSRTPKLPEQTLAMLLEKARNRGYDTSQLIFPIQE